MIRCSTSFLLLLFTKIMGNWNELSKDNFLSKCTIVHCLGVVCCTLFHRCTWCTFWVLKKKGFLFITSTMLKALKCFKIAISTKAFQTSLVLVFETVIKIELLRDSNIGSTFKYLEFSNFSCIFLDLNNFFQFEF